MTIEELNYLFYLDDAIRMERDKLATLRESLDVKSPIITDMPKASGARDKLGETVPEIADKEANIANTIAVYVEMKAKAENFINHTFNPKMRLILTKRYLEQKTWQDIANEIAGKETEETVKKACYRYVAQRNNEEEARKTRETGKINLSNEKVQKFCP